MTIISAYAPMLVSPEETKDDFYASLDTAVRCIPAADKIALLGDFNAHIGKNTEVWQGVIGKHAIEKMNSNSLRLLSFSTEHQLCITNTLFQLPDNLEVTWMHPQSKNWHLLDYVIVCSRDIQDIYITRAMRGAECWTNLRLIRSTFKAVLRPPARKQHPNHVSMLLISGILKSSETSCLSLTLNSTLSQSQETC